MKKIIASLLAVLVVAVFGGIALGASNDVSLVFNVFNRASITNTSSLTANTGLNVETAGTDIEAGSTISGDVEVSSVIDNDLNSTNHDVAVTDANDIAVAVSGDNDAEIENVALVEANTGENTAVAGTDIASASPGYTTSTGNITYPALGVTSGITNNINSTKTLLRIETSDDVAYGQTIVNRLTLANASLPTLNTGVNSHIAGTDIEGGVIGTGNAEGSSVIDNDLNSTDVDGQVKDANDVAGVVGVDNDFKVGNIADLNLNTGENTKTAGTDSSGGTIDTGSASGLKGILNKFNFSKFVFKVL